MDRFLRHSGVGVPLPQSNIDTDQILPARYLKSITRTGFAGALFERWRQDENFVLNQEPYRKGSILVAGPDFGTGSSREHAVWALKDYGFRAVICARFGDIFRGNAGKQGLLAAQVPQTDIERLWDYLFTHPGASLTVDLVERTLGFGETELPFTIDVYTRWRLMEGHDDISVTEQYAQLIDQYEAARPPCPSPHEGTEG